MQNPGPIRIRGFILKEKQTMKFRPCIDIHNGKVKQIVGGSLKDAGDQAKENFVSGQDATFMQNYTKTPD